MKVKIHNKVPGIPRAQAVVAGGEENQARTINVFVSALDEFSNPTVVASLRMTPAEAKDLALRLAHEAERAESAMATKDQLLDPALELLMAAK